MRERDDSALVLGWPAPGVVKQMVLLGTDHEPAVVMIHTMNRRSLVRRPLRRFQSFDASLALVFR